MRAVAVNEPLQRESRREADRLRRLQKKIVAVPMEHRLLDPLEPVDVAAPKVYHPRPRPPLLAHLHPIRNSTEIDS